MTWRTRGLAEDPVTQEFLQHPFERLSAVSVERGVQDVVAERLPGPSEDVVPHGGKDLGTAMHVEVADFSGRLSGAEPQGEDSAGRRAGDQIEMTDDGVAGAESGLPDRQARRPGKFRGCHRHR